MPAEGAGAGARGGGGGAVCRGEGWREQRAVGCGLWRAGDVVPLSDPADQLAADLELDRRACERIAERFCATAEVLGEKCLHHRAERDAILLPHEAVAFV